MEFFILDPIFDPNVRMNVYLRNTRNAIRQLEEHIMNGCAMAGEEENTEVTTFMKRVTHTL
jgi:hypothetical protein